KLNGLVNAQARTDEKLNLLVDAQGRTDENFNAKIDALVDAQGRTAESVQRTDEAVRNLTVVVDRYFREGRNGG
ncbi:MAG: hypothetical protein QOC99_2002, partial [Acidobacteriota bacterium]|nr:hypothetical protein [Acidobacteriota bacterium]